MTERKLHVVKAPREDLVRGSDPLAGEDERLAADVLRAAVELGDEPFTSSLRAALAPQAIDDPDHEALLARALGDRDAPATEAERGAAEKLRAAFARASRVPSPMPADAEEDAAVLRAVRFAIAPIDLNTRSRESILARVLEDPAAPASPDEVREATKLRDALETGAALPAMIETLRAAERPRTLDAARNEILIEAALARGRRRPGVAPVFVAGVLAMAAAFALVARQAVRSASPPETPSMAAAPFPEPMLMVDATLFRSRSTAELFDPARPFPRFGGESVRVDRIAGARAMDLRANRFKIWGVR